MILLDENLSPKLVARLNDVLPMVSAQNVGLRQASDLAVWTYAVDHEFDAILTADKDFAAMAAKLGSPPKVIRLDRHNYSTQVVEEVIRRDLDLIFAFLRSSDTPLLVLAR